MLPGLPLLSELRTIGIPKIVMDPLVPTYLGMLTAELMRGTSLCFQLCANLNKRSHKRREIAEIFFFPFS